MKSKTKKTLPSTKAKLSLGKKFMLSVFMESVPALIDMWKSKQTDLSFDCWLMDIYEANKNLKKGGS